MTAAALLSLYLLACLLPTLLYSVDSSGVAARDKERERARRRRYAWNPCAPLTTGTADVTLTWRIRPDRLPPSRWGSTRTQP